MDVRYLGYISDSELAVLSLEEIEGAIAYQRYWLVVLRRNGEGDTREAASLEWALERYEAARRRAFGRRAQANAAVTPCDFVLRLLRGLWTVYLLADQFCRIWDGD